MSRGTAHRGSAALAVLLALAGTASTDARPARPGQPGPLKPLPDELQPRSLRSGGLPAVTRPAPVRPAGDTPVPRQGGDTPETAVELAGWPLVISGTTAGYADDHDLACPDPSSGPDVFYRLELAAPAHFALDLCGSGFPARLAVYSGGTEPEQLLACTSTGCPGGAGRLENQLLPAGSLLLVVDGAGGQAGDYTLTVWNPCGAASALACGTQVAIADSVTGNAWQEYCVTGEDGPELAFAVDHPGGLLDARLQGLNAQDHDLVLLADCDPGSCLQMPFEGDSDERISNALPAGSYHLVVDLWHWTGEGIPGQGLDFTLSLDCDPAPCDDVPVLDCQGRPEHEPNGGWDQGQQADSITCGDTLCGVFWADGGMRDLDWMRLEHPGGPLIARLSAVQSNAVLFLTTVAPPDAGGRTLYTIDRRPFCEGEDLVLDWLPPGSYFLVVAHNAFLGVPQDEPWQLVLECPDDPCLAHEPVDCGPGIAESEPNEGWNSNNQNWNTAAAGDRRCGTLWANNGLRDTDWYRFSLAEPSAVALACDGDELDPVLFLFTAVMPPAGRLLAGADNLGLCQPESLFVASLPAGEYYAMVAHNRTSGVPVPSNYVLDIHSLPPVTGPDPCEDRPLLTLTAAPQTLVEPAPDTNGFDGGAACDGTVSGGSDRLYDLHVPVGGEWVLTLTGEGERADEVLAVLDGCGPDAVCLEALDEQGAGPGGEQLQVELAAGSYTLVADYWGSLESHPYTLEIVNLATVGPGGPDAEVSPRSFRLDCTPNPFNPRTRLSWAHPGGAATLSVYNIRGARVHHELLSAAPVGERFLDFDGGRLASGVYLLHVETPDGAGFRGKALLLK